MQHYVHFVVKILFKIYCKRDKKYQIRSKNMWKLKLKNGVDLFYYIGVYV